MLKIIDNYNLDDLKKLGFKYQRETATQYEGYLFENKLTDDFYPCMRCFVFAFDRHIIVNSREIDILFDLIQAGFVEKVGCK